MDKKQDPAQTELAGGFTGINRGPGQADLRARVMGQVTLDNQASDGSHPVIVDLNAQYLQTEKYWAPLSNAAITLVFYSDKDGGRQIYNAPVQAYLDKDLTKPVSPVLIYTDNQGHLKLYITCSSGEQTTYYISGDVDGVGGGGSGNITFNNEPGDPLRYAIHFFKPGHPIITGTSQ